MVKRKFLSGLTTSLAIVSLTLGASPGHACTFMAIDEIQNNSMALKCKQALARPKGFLEKVRKGKISGLELDSYVLAFDGGKSGCREDKQFVFRILSSFYSVGDRKLTEPRLLQRYAFSFPDDLDAADRRYAYYLVWLFNENTSYLPPGKTQAQAREFVDRPEHWPIALAKFGNSRERDDAVFASVSDPQSSHFDRQLALRLAGFESTHKKQRKVSVAELFADARFGAVDLPLAESLLPATALYGAISQDPARQRARSVWVKIADGYLASSDPALRAKGAELRAKMAPSTLNDWQAFAPPNDGRVWLSPADWPKKVRNPLATVRISENLMTANDYPVRALREGQNGRVGLAVRFGADGKFAALDVVRSSGSAVLDAAAASTLTRRVRPKLSDLTLEGYPGREVMVPLVIVNWEISDEPEEGGNSGISHYADGVLSVVALARTYNPGYSCGFPPSPFL